ncbi:tripartite tricarboxylate transporter substrate binding protein [Pigmentiphaga soli]|uniref:Tripartite tricarboxylate transporter substrate binding protein n=1 Tax=Pigmentiphaga soli TaxID=1007095 RepID=A0ABP8HS25_9BURK
MDRRNFLLSAAIGGLASSAARAQGESFPTRPLRLVVPFPPGGAVDVNARMLARAVEPILGQPVVVDNRGGANGIIAYDMVAKSQPDGYTLLHTSIGIVLNPSIYKKLPYDTVRDFLPITDALVGQGAVLVINPKLPARNLREFIEYAKTHPSSYGSPGVGNSMHLIGNAFDQKAGTHMQHVPYKGAGPALNGLVAGDIQAMFVPAAVAAPYLKNGQLRAVGYSTSKRLDIIPDVPTIDEAGVPGFDMSTGWHSWFAPAGTPAPVIDRIYGALRTALAQDSVRDYFIKSGYVPTAHPPSEFKQIFMHDLATWGAVAKAANIQPD